MAYTYEEQDNGELLVKDLSKGVWQTVPNIARPYNLIYLPVNNNIMAVQDLNEITEDFQHIKVVK